MRKIFLFRFDGKTENEEFLGQARSTGHFVYQGTEMKLSHGWVPDFIEVSLDDDPAVCSLTIFELESNESEARKSARKYLPESSQDTLATFQQYLRRALQRCRSTADSRAEDIQYLENALNRARTLTVWTAGALRSPPKTIERLPLIDQGIALDNSPADSASHTRTSKLAGEVLLSSRDHKALFRSVLILDAVVRGWDKSDASLRAWRNLRSQPLKRDIQQNPNGFPTLFALLLGQKTGTRVMIDDAAREIAVIWNKFQPGRHTERAVLAAIEAFLPFERQLVSHESVRKAFEKARLVLRDGAE